MKKRLLLYKNAKQLLTDNPKLSCKKFVAITGLFKEDYYLIKEEISPSKAWKEIALKLELKRKRELELRQFLKDNGHLNTKGTFLERN